MLSSNNWITDRNPSRDGEYIVTCEGATFATSLFYEDGQWVLNEWQPNVTFKVIAWQPMPEAYKGD